MKLSRRAIQFIFLLPVFVILLSGIAVFAHYPKSLIQAFRIPSVSMAPTLIVGDQILVNMLSYSFRVVAEKNSVEPLMRYRIPARGDVVVFTLPDDPATEEDESRINNIKRVIGLPGDKIRLDKTTLYINDKIVEESYAQYQLGGIKDFGPAIVPPDSVFLLGDNRDRSKDSRYWSNSFVTVDHLIGKVFLIYLNFKETGRGLLPVH